MTENRLEKRVTRRLYALATLANHGRLSDKQLRYVEGLLDHFYKASKEMTDEQA